MLKFEPKIIQIILGKSAEIFVGLCLACFEFRFQQRPQLVDFKPYLLQYSLLIPHYGTTAGTLCFVSNF